MDDLTIITYFIAVLIGALLALSLFGKFLIRILGAMRGGPLYPGGVYQPTVYAQPAPQPAPAKKSSGGSYAWFFWLILIVLGYLWFSAADTFKSPPEQTRVKPPTRARSTPPTSSERRPAPPPTNSSPPTAFASTSTLKAERNRYTGSGLQLAAFSRPESVYEFVASLAGSKHEIAVFGNRKGLYCVVIPGFSSRARATDYKKAYRLKAFEVDLSDYLVVCSPPAKTRSGNREHI